MRNHWKKVIFSDETKIEIGNNRRKVDERLRPNVMGCTRVVPGSKLQNEILSCSGAAFRIIYTHLYPFPMKAGGS